MWIIQWSSETSPWTNLYNPYSSYESAQEGLKVYRKHGGKEFNYRLLKCEVLND